MTLNSSGWSNRGWLEIIEHLLVLAKGGSRRTHMMFRCNLNSKQTAQYIKFLIETGMMEEKREHPNSKRFIYTTTERGLKFLSRYDTLIALFDKKEIK